MHISLRFALLFALIPITLAAPAEQAKEKNADTDQEISQLEQKRADELLFYIQLLILKKDYPRAAEEVSRVLITPPTDSDSLLKLRELAGDVALGLLRAEKAPKQAAELCEKLADNLGNDAIYLYLAGMAYKQLGTEAKQKKCEDTARAVRNDDQAYWFNVGSFFARRKELTAALKAFDAAATISSDNPTHFNADSEDAMASIYCRLGDYEKALTHCKNLQEIARKILVSRTRIALLTALVYAEKAREAVIAEKYDEAIEDYKMSAEFSPQPAAAYVSIGEQYLNSGKYHEAQRWFKQAADTSGSPMAYAGLGDVQKAQGNPNEAENQYAKCEKGFAQAIKKNPHDASNYNNLAWFYATHARKLDEGIKLAKKALELAPDSAQYLDTLAELYYRTGDRAAAIREIKKAIALNPPHMKYYHKQLQRFQKELPREPQPVSSLLPPCPLR